MKLVPLHRLINSFCRMKESIVALWWILSIVGAIFMAIAVVRRFARKHPDPKEKIQLRMRRRMVTALVRTWKVMFFVWTFIPGFLGCFFVLSFALRPFQGIVIPVEGSDRTGWKDEYYFYYQHPSTQEKITMRNKHDYYINLSKKDLLLIPITASIDDSIYTNIPFPADGWVVCDYDVEQDVSDYYLEYRDKNFSRNRYRKADVVYMIVDPIIYHTNQSFYDSICVQDKYIFVDKPY